MTTITIIAGLLFLAFFGGSLLLIKMEAEKRELEN